ncbi:MAG: ABC transporter substrate-binding protein [Sulfolobales archaeon]
MRSITRIWAIVIALIVVIAAIAGIISIQMLSPRRAPQQTIATQPPTPLTIPQASPSPTQATTPLQPMGPPVQKITIITTTEAENPQRWAAVQAIAAEWRKLGFEVEVIGLEASQVDKKCYYEWDFDVCVFGWGARIDRLDPNLFLGLITTSEIGKKGEGANNPTGYSNPEYDRLYDLQKTTLDPEKRREIVYRLQQIFHEEAPRYNLYHSFVLAAYNSKKWSNPLIMPGNPLFHEWQPYFITPATGSMQELIYASNTEPDSLNPLKASLIFSWYVLKFIYDSLVRLGPDGRPIPWLAESIAITSPTTVEVKIRGNAVFHDGKPITADDVKFSYDYYIKNNFAYFRPYFRNIDKVEVINQTAVRFYLKSPDASFITNSLYMIPILPKHVWENITDPGSLTEDQLAQVLKVGSGPFRNPVWVRKEYISMEVFPGHFAYRGIDIPGFKVPPIKVSRITIKIYGDLEGVVNALILGQADATAVSLLPGHVDVLSKYDYISIIKGRGFALDADLMFNVRRSPFDLKLVRQALLYAVPYDYIINVILKGYGEKGYIIAPVNSFWHNPDVLTYSYNLSKARELLAKAGFTWDASGRIHYPANYTIKRD